MSRITRIAPVLLIVACGKQAEPVATPDAQPVSDAAPAPTTAAPTPTEAVATDVAAPTEPAPDAAPPEETVVGMADAEPAPPDDDAIAGRTPSTTEVIDPAGLVEPDAGGAEPLPADLPKMPGVDPAVVARLVTGEPGCVGLGKSARAVLSIVEGMDHETGQRGKVLVWNDLADGSDEDRMGWDVPASPRDLASDEALLGAIRGKGLVACRTSGPGLVDKAVPISVTGNDKAITVAIEGNLPHVIDVRRDIFHLELQRVYWAPEVGRLYLRVANTQDSNALESMSVIVVEPAALGASGCVPRPTGGKVLAAEPPPFDAAPPEVSCVAMTADGAMAAFKTWSVDSMPDGQGGGGKANTIEWFGAGTAPAIDLQCMARRSCKAEDKKRISEEAARLGLVGCSPVKGSATVDQREAKVMYKDNAYWLMGGSGWRKVHAFRWGHDGEGHESLWKAFQHPRGGPIFLYVGNEDTGVEEALVYAVDDKAMNLCPAPAEGAFEVADVKVSSAARDGGGYKFGAANLADNDLTTSWQPAEGKAGEAPWIEIPLAAETAVAGIEIANGFQRRDGLGDLFDMNARVASATLTFSDGTTEALTLAPDARGLVRHTFAPRKTTRVKLTIDALHDGSRWAKDVAISEVRLVAAAP
ncbi:MAG: hypothetical protein IT385_14220 [Deltaproteobacteria bacterium]|nr:hypothetical protein [Deltaproteobacteria bacterium]